MAAPRRRRTACCVRARRGCVPASTPRSIRARAREAHHDLGPAHQCHGPRRVESCVGEQRCHHADLARPIPVPGTSTVTADLARPPRAHDRGPRRRRAGRGSRRRRARTPGRRVRGAGPSSSSTAPRSGARPMPPATTTTSPCGPCPQTHRVLRSPQSSPQSVPNGPRTPTIADPAQLHRAWVTGPDVADRVLERAGGPGERCSPRWRPRRLPNAVSMLNWPARKSIAGPATGTSDRAGHDVVGLLAALDHPVGDRRHDGPGALWPA